MAAHVFCEVMLPKKLLLTKLTRKSMSRAPIRIPNNNCPASFFIFCLLVKFETSFLYISCLPYRLLPSYPQQFSSFFNRALPLASGFFPAIPMKSIIIMTGIIISNDTGSNIPAIIRYASVVPANIVGNPTKGFIFGFPLRRYIIPAMLSPINIPSTVLSIATPMNFITSMPIHVVITAAHSEHILRLNIFSIRLFDRAYAMKSAVIAPSVMVIIFSLHHCYPQYHHCEHDHYYPADKLDVDAFFRFKVLQPVDDLLVRRYAEHYYQRHYEHQVVQQKVNQSLQVLRLHKQKAQYRKVYPCSAAE